MTEVQRIIASMSPAELVLYRRSGGDLPRALAAVADAFVVARYDATQVWREGIPSTFVRKHVPPPVSEPRKVNRERRNAKRRQQRAIERLRRRIAA